MPLIRGRAGARRDTLAASASLGADPAVFVHPGVMFAFCRADAADGPVVFEKGADDIGVGVGLAAEDGSGALADRRNLGLFDCRR